MHDRAARTPIPLSSEKFFESFPTGCVKLQDFYGFSRLNKDFGINLMTGP